MDFFFLFGIPRLVGHRSFHLRQQKRQEFQAAPPLHQKSVHYSRYLRDYILQQEEDVIKRSQHSHFDLLVSNYFYTHASHLLDFNMNDVILFDIKYFFQVAYQVLLIIKILIYFIKC